MAARSKWVWLSTSLRQWQFPAGWNSGSIYNEFTLVQVALKQQGVEHCFPLLHLPAQFNLKLGRSNRKDVSEWVSKWVSEWVSEWVSRVSEWVSEWVEWVSRVSEWVSEWVEWVSEWSVRYSLDPILSRELNWTFSAKPNEVDRLRKSNL